MGKHNKEKEKAYRKRRRQTKRENKRQDKRRISNIGVEHADSSDAAAVRGETSDMSNAETTVQSYISPVKANQKVTSSFESAFRDSMCESDKDLDSYSTSQSCNSRSLFSCSTSSLKSVEPSKDSSKSFIGHLREIKTRRDVLDRDPLYARWQEYKLLSRRMKQLQNI